jgi:hypothetical protein
MDSATRTVEIVIFTVGGITNCSNRLDLTHVLQCDTMEIRRTSAVARQYVYPSHVLQCDTMEIRRTSAVARQYVY